MATPHFSLALGLKSSSHIRIGQPSSSYLHDKTTVRGGVEIGPTECLSQPFPRWVIRRLSVCARVPHREGNSMGGLPLFSAGVQNRRGCCERQTQLKIEPGTPGPRPCMLSTNPSLHAMKQYWCTHTPN